MHDDEKVEERISARVAADLRRSRVVKLTLRVRCSGTEYDAEASTIRVKGINKTECEEVKLNAHHTLEVGIGRGVKIEKETWDKRRRASVGGGGGSGGERGRRGGAPGGWISEHRLSRCDADDRQGED